VVLPDGSSVVATVKQDDGKLTLVSGATTKTVASSEISLMRNDAEQKAYERLLKPGLLDLWAGSGSIGFAGTSGNAKTTTFTTGLNAARITRTDKTNLYFNTIKASALINGRNAGAAEAVRGGWGYARNLKPKLFANVFNDWEYDKFQNLDLRAVLGGGLGYKAINTDRVKLDLLGGAAYNYSRFITFTRKTGELYWGNNFRYTLNSATTMFRSFRMFNDMNSLGDYRVNFDVGATTKLSKWLTWNVSLSDR